MNKIMMINPYLYNGEWVFDDIEKGLDKELLIAGMPEMIDAICSAKKIKDYKKGFKAIFSDEPFPGHDAVLDWIREGDGDGGNWYEMKITGMEGWLCAALEKYFDKAPKHIYVQVKEW